MGGLFETIVGNIRGQAVETTWVWDNWPDCPWVWENFPEAVCSIQFLKTTKTDFSLSLNLYEGQAGSILNNEKQRSVKKCPSIVLVPKKDRTIKVM